MINKFEGDAALAIFGAPVPTEDAAGHALAAARELNASAQPLGRRDQGRHRGVRRKSGGGQHR